MESLPARMAICCSAGPARSSVTSCQHLALDANGGDPKQLSFGAYDANPVCSPDSKWAYYGDQNTGLAMRVPLDGASKPEVIPGTEIPHAIISSRQLGVSPDGKYFAVRAYDPAGRRGQARAC